ncbi:50S ribosome-binding GTPase [Chromobacterium haemolyticum]|nr:50S ribosome-binding GTPase [Chromobacterium haemolyticum]
MQTILVIDRIIMLTLDVFPAGRHGVVDRLELAEEAMRASRRRLRSDAGVPFLFAPGGALGRAFVAGCRRHPLPAAAQSGAFHRGEGGSMKRFALIGLPNTGKSTLFNRLTGMSQRVGNWPGLTIELSSARVLLGGHMVELVDLPGVHDLTGYSDDEAVVRDVLLASAFDGAILVLNASQLDRQLPLALQVLASGLNCQLVLNMADESQGIGREPGRGAFVGTSGRAGIAGVGQTYARLAAADGEFEPAGQRRRSSRESHAGRGTGYPGGDGGGQTLAGRLLGLAADAAGEADRKDRPLADASVAGFAAVLRIDGAVVQSDLSDRHAFAGAGRGRAGLGQGAGAGALARAVA